MNAYIKRACQFSAIATGLFLGQLAYKIGIPHNNDIEKLPTEKNIATLKQDILDVPDDNKPLILLINGPDNPDYSLTAQAGRNYLNYKKQVLFKNLDDKSHFFALGNNDSNIFLREEDITDLLVAVSNAKAKRKIVIFSNHGVNENRLAMGSKDVKRDVIFSAIQNKKNKTSDTELYFLGCHNGENLINAIKPETASIKAFGYNGVSNPIKSADIFISLTDRDDLPNFKEISHKLSLECNEIDIKDNIIMTALKKGSDAQGSVYNAGQYIDYNQKLTGFFSNIEQKKTNVTGKEALWLQNEIREKEIYVTKVLASKEKREFFKILELRQNYLDINKLIVLQHTTTHTTPPALVAPMPK